MDSLEKLFGIQKKHNDVWQDAERFMTDKNYRLSVVKDVILGIHQQNTFLLETFNWAKHSLERDEDSHNSKIQIIDIVKYSLALFILMGGTEKEFEQLFVSKSDELDRKWQQNKVKFTSENKVVIFDLDGVIADYSKQYSEFLELVIGLKPNKDDRKSYSFFERYGITRQQEETFNLEFIKSGGFISLPVFDGVISVMKKIKKEGIKIVLLTARPSWLFKRLITDTYSWLQSNKIPYDLLIWDKDKADAIINNVMPANILCMIEDRDKHAIEVSHIGVDVLLLNKSYNKTVVENEKIKRINDYLEILTHIKSKRLENNDGK